MRNHIEKTGQLIASSFNLAHEDLNLSIETFRERASRNPSLILEAHKIRSCIESGEKHEAILLLDMCFGIKGTTALRVIQDLQSPRAS